MTNTNATIDPALTGAKMTLRALINRIRHLIILEISIGTNRRTVTDIVTTLNLQQLIASQHLAILRRAKVVTTQKEGKNVYYSVDQKAIEKIKFACMQME